MRGWLAAFAACLALPALALGACSQHIKGVDEDALVQAVGAAIGDPDTCVVLSGAGGDVVWRYGTHMTCSRTLPDCSGGQITVEDLGKAAARGDVRDISCPSIPDGTRSVGWATGPVQPGKGAAHQPLYYAAVMEGERALPGREIRLRLERALADAGL